MSKGFPSNIDLTEEEAGVKFTEEEVEVMVTDLRDLLGRLQEQHVLDFSKEKGIMLLDSNNTMIEFKRTEITEVKRFISLVKSCFLLLTHLTRNLTWQTSVQEVVRKDRIMGSINIQKTILRNRYYDIGVVCSLQRNS